MKSWFRVLSLVAIVTAGCQSTETHAPYASSSQPADPMPYQHAMPSYGYYGQSPATQPSAALPNNYHNGRQNLQWNQSFRSVSYPNSPQTTGPRPALRLQRSASACRTT